MKALVFGAGGMLGRALVEELENSLEPWGVVAVPHGLADIAEGSAVYDLIRRHRPLNRVYNCAGVLNTSGDSRGMVRANALGPHVIADVTRVLGIPLIHVSTDCVFSGRSSGHWPARQSYVSNIHVPDPTDLYGRTKLVGEVDAPHVTNVRTSFVGPAHGLWPWLVEQAENGARVEGWSKARWSGSTVGAVARALASEIPENAGLVHLATKTPISKYDALCLLRKELGLEVEIVIDSHVRVDRALYPTHELQSFASALEVIR